MDLASPRWKKGGSAIAVSNPMSAIVAKLQTNLLHSKAQAFLSGSDAFLEATSQQRDLLSRASFGTLDADMQLFQLNFEEAFYLCRELKCLLIVGEGGQLIGEKEIWDYMVSLKRMFPWHYKAYCHLRSKNWVVHSGSMYGADFVVYRHHPALVHSEFAAIVVADGDDKEDTRLRAWSDWEGMIRVCGSVAKTLLIIYVGNDDNHVQFPSCLEHVTVNLQTITRWDPDRCREDDSVIKREKKGKKR